MIGPDGYDSPSPVGPLLIWQQPHPIYYAELCYRERPTRRTLEQWRRSYSKPPNFMASYAVCDGHAPVCAGAADEDSFGEHRSADGFEPDV